MLVIAINIILVGFISSIFIPITYQLFMSCFIPNPSYNNRNKPSKITNIFIGNCIFLSSFILSLLIIGNSGTPFQKLSDICCNYYYHSLIHLTYFNTYYFLLGFHTRIYFQNKNRKQHSRRTICHTRC